MEELGLKGTLEFKGRPADMKDTATSPSSLVKEICDGEKGGLNTGSREGVTCHLHNKGSREKKVTEFQANWGDQFYLNIQRIETNYTNGMLHGSDGDCVCYWSHVF